MKSRERGVPGRLFCWTFVSSVRRNRPWGLGPALGLFILLSVLACAPLAWAQEELYVANSLGNSVTVYPRTASGNIAPLRTLAGPATGLDSPMRLVVDTINNELLVANLFSITVYPRAASGDTAPLRTLSGPATGLNQPRGLVVDTVNNELLVVNLFSITVYPRTASGDTAPLRTVSGLGTGLDFSSSADADRVHDELVVGNSSFLAPSSITVYPRTASGNTPPLRTVVGAATGLVGPAGLAVDTLNSELVVVNADGFGGNPSITVYPRTANGNVAPLRSLQGPATGLSLPGGVALDAATNELVVTNRNNNSITVYPRTASGNAAPVQTLQGPDTGLSSPSFVAIATAPSAAVALTGSVFASGQTITYEATLTPGDSLTQVDIYCGALLPDLVTFLSLVQVSPGVISVVLGPAPVPYLANVTLAPLVVPFAYTFTGAEPVGTYFTYAGIAVAGSDAFVPANQLALAIQAFQFNP